MTEETILDKAKGGGDWDEPLIYYSYELLAGSYSTDPITFRPASNNVPVLFKVPGACKYLKVDCVGATGGGNSGGAGGRVQCILDVRENKRLYIFAGKYHGTSYDSRVYDASHISTSYSYNEGNTSALNQRLVVAGAGGNRYQGYGAGAGGGLTGGTAAGDIIHPGYGGTQTAGGAPSHNIRGSIRGTPNFGNAGVFGYGGSGPYPGGAGWYGGGSGGTCYVSKAGTQWAGAGGGSSYTKSGLCKEVVHTQGYNKNGNGWVTIQCLRGGVTILNIEGPGSCTINHEDNSISGFSTDNCPRLRLNNISTYMEYFEIQFKIKTGSSWTSSGRIINITGEGNQFGDESREGPYIEANSNRIALVYPEKGSSHTKEIEAITSPKLNTIYWIKWIYDKTSNDINAYYSLDGKTWIFNKVISFTSYSWMMDETFDIGCRSLTKKEQEVFKGTIYLSESYIYAICKYKGTISWKGIVKS